MHHKKHFNFCSSCHSFRSFVRRFDVPVKKYLQDTLISSNGIRLQIFSEHVLQSTQEKFLHLKTLTSMLTFSSHLRKVVNTVSKNSAENGQIKLLNFLQKH